MQKTPYRYLIFLMDIENIDIVQIADISTIQSTINRAKAHKIMADKILNKK